MSARCWRARRAKRFHKIKPDEVIWQSFFVDIYHPDRPTEVLIAEINGKRVKL